MKQDHLQVKRTERQIEAWDAFFEMGVRELMYGGAKGGGKSFLLCVLLYTISMVMIKVHNLQASSKPIHWAWMGRKVGSDFVGTTLDTWQRVIPSDCYRICGASDIHPRHILIWDRIAIDFGGLDSQQAINKFNSAEYALIAVDQAEETTKDDVAVLMGSRRLMIKGKPWLSHTKDICKMLGVAFHEEYDGKPFPFKGIWTANPAQCWLKSEFLDNPKDGYKFVKALPSDNPHLPEDYASVTLVEAFGHQPELLKAYLHGDWDLMSGVDQIISSRWVTDAKLQIRHDQTNRIHVSCDTARFGDDQTVILAFNHLELIDSDAQGYTTAPQVANSFISMCRKHGTRYGTIESTGGDLGAGVIDIVRDTAPDLIIKQFTPQGGSKNQPLNPDTGKPMQIYGNERAEAWVYTAKQFSDFKIQIPKDAPLEITTQLCWPKYKYRNGKTYVESKDDIKARMQKSPDWGDAYVMGIWGSQFVEGEGSVSNLLSVSKIRQFIRKYS